MAKISHVSVLTDILFERNGSQSSVKDVEEMKVKLQVLVALN